VQRAERLRLGVLTGGGDCPGLNAVIRAVVTTALVEYGWEVLGILDGFEGLLADNRTRQLTEADVRDILPRGGTILGTTNRSNPFRCPVQRDGSIVYVDRSQEVAQRVRDLGLDCLIVIGGDGTLAIARDLQPLGVNVVGVPKTIDNDVAATDVTFGFDTALHVATDAIDRLHTTAESHHRVMVLELMGRTVGWIALHAGLAGGAHVILIPEIPFRMEKVREAVARRDAAGAHFSIVVVAEGASPVGGLDQPERRAQDAAGFRLDLRRIGNWVATEVSRGTAREARCTVLGHLQRGGSPSPFDRILGTRFGAAAVRLVAEGRFGQMVALRGGEITAVTLAEACGVLKSVPPDGELVRTARGLGISFGD